MKKKLCVVFFMLTVTFSLIAQNNLPQNPSAAQLLHWIDSNEIYETIEYRGEMLIEYNNRRVVKTMNVWARGNNRSFMEFTNPEDRDYRYLRRDGRLMVYSPDIEGVMLISGHMLKESIMGSDLSYEDTLDNASLSSRYRVAFLPEESFNARRVWVLELNALSQGESYPRRVLRVDMETGDLLQTELFALSGSKLKEFNLLDVEIINGRRFPVTMEVRDLLRRDSRTIFTMRDVVLNQPIAESVFSERNLRR